MSVSVGSSPKRFIEAASGNNRLATAARQVRHGAAALPAERGCKASGLRQVEADDGLFSPKPSKRRRLHDHLARMRGSGRLSTTWAMAVQELLKWSLDLERDLAAQATPPECCHCRLPCPVPPDRHRRSPQL